MLGILFASVQNVLKDRLCGKWNVGTWSVHHDTVPSYCELLVKRNMAITGHTRDSPDLVPCDFFFSAKTEDSLKWKEIE
jgi:hypothetical protein